MLRFAFQQPCFGSNLEDKLDRTETRGSDTVWGACVNCRGDVQDAWKER